MAVVYLYPSSDSSVTWSSTGTPHYDEINEVYTSPSTTDYIYTSSDLSNITDKFGFTDMPASSAISEVRIYLYAKKRLNESSFIAVVVGFFSFILSALTTSYAWHNSVITLDHASWTTANVNSLELGFQSHVSPHTGDTLYIAAAYIKVTYTEPATGTNTQINIGDTWKDIEGMKINIGDSWKAVEGAQINIGDSWKTIF